ncbi:hypothetical protein M405DRAFT_860255 [Rhizopogon salebrosus TDB-379]|nr:hypothetical protein M405DRAFT_860255 [Rhizopogon salebrosus TDB-379]
MSFRRIKHAKARHAQEVETPRGIPSVYDYLEAEFRRDYAFFVYPSTIVATSGWDIVSEEREMEGNESSKEYFKLLPDGYTKRHSLDKIILAPGSKLAEDGYLREV